MDDAHVVDLRMLAKFPAAGGAGDRPVHEQAKCAHYETRAVYPASFSQLDACRVVGHHAKRSVTSLVLADERTEAGLNHSQKKMVGFYDRQSELIGQLGRQSQSRPTKAPVPLTDGN